MVEGHPYDIPQKVQLVLGDRCFNTLATCSFENLSVFGTVTDGTCMKLRVAASVSPPTNLTLSQTHSFTSGRHSVMPSDSQDVLETADVEVFQGPDVVAVSNPGFTAVEEGGDADSLVDADFCVEMKVLILKNPPPEFSKGS